MAKTTGFVSFLYRTLLIRPFCTSCLSSIFLPVTLKTISASHIEGWFSIPNVCICRREQACWRSYERGCTVIFLLLSSYATLWTEFKNKYMQYVVTNTGAHLSEIMKCSSKTINKLRWSYNAILYLMTLVKNTSLQRRCLILLNACCIDFSFLVSYPRLLLGVGIKMPGENARKGIEDV